MRNKRLFMCIAQVRFTVLYTQTVPPPHLLVHLEVNPGCFAAFVLLSSLFSRVQLPLQAKLLSFKCHAKPQFRRPSHGLEHCVNSSQFVKTEAIQSHTNFSKMAAQFSFDLSR